MEVLSVYQGVCCEQHPIKFALDPYLGRWAVTGSETGRVCLYDLHSNHIEPVKQIIGASASAEHEGGPRGPRTNPAYCVAWNPKLHAIAVCTRHAGGHVQVLIHDKRTANQQTGRCVF